MRTADSAASQSRRPKRRLRHLSVLGPVHLDQRPSSISLIPPFACTAPRSFRGEFIFQEHSMKSYLGSEIRNVAVAGHAHGGKTTLVSALLHAARMTPKLGRVEDGSAVTAYDEEEVSRRTTMQNAVAFAEWNGVKVNFIDTPGFHMFVHEARCAMLPVEAALVTVHAVSGVEAMTERVWKYAEEFNLPRAVVINQMDHPRAAQSAEATLTALSERFGRQCIPVQLPIVDGKGFEGVVDLVTREAFFYTPGGDGHGKIGEI